MGLARAEFAGALLGGKELHPQSKGRPNGEVDNAAASEPIGEELAEELSDELNGRPFRATHFAATEPMLS